MEKNEEPASAVEEVKVVFEKVVVSTCPHPMVSDQLTAEGMSWTFFPLPLVSSFVWGGSSNENEQVQGGRLLKRFQP